MAALRGCSVKELIVRGVEGELGGGGRTWDGITLPLIEIEKAVRRQTDQTRPSREILFP